jgi:lectin, mannose-binding 2
MHPYISVMINNGTLHYDHDRDGQSTIAAGCSSPFRDRDTETSVAIRYQKERLTVSTDTEGTNTWTECFALSDVHLPTMYYFGLSAATGELSDNHDIISVHTYRLASIDDLTNLDRSQIIPSAPAMNSSNLDSNHTKSSFWSTIKIFLRVVAVIFVCAAGAVGLYYYLQKRRYFRPTLY